MTTPEQKQKPKAYRKGNQIVIKFSYDKELVAKVKMHITGRRYDPTNKLWKAPAIVENIQKLKAWGFELSEDLNKVLETSSGKTAQEQKELEVPGLKKKLYPFQRKGVSFIESRHGRALIADEMGLGKTIQALAWLQLHPEKRPVIIVVPASLKWNWYKEIKETMTNNTITFVANGTKPMPINKYDIVIINYDILTYWLEAIKKIKPQVLVVDECHYIKNNSAKRTKAVKELGKVIPNVIALSGTPIINRPAEIFNSIKLVNPYLFGSWWKFAHRYCAPKHNGFGWDFSGASNTEELHKKLTESIMIRRLKSEVLSDLPDKIRSFVPVEINNEAEYRRAENDLIGWLKETKGEDAAVRASYAETLVKIETLKLLAINGKMKQIIEWIRDFIDADGKLVVFAVHKHIIDKIYSEFKDIAVKIDGSVKVSDRQKVVNEFQENPKVRLFIGNIKAAGVGLTLTAASSVAFVELPWTPGELDQAEDRCHRIGQKDSVNVYYLLAQNTIEEEIARLLDSKRKVLDSVLDGKDTDERTLLTELINNLAQK